MKRSKSWVMPFVSFFLVGFVTVYMGYHIITALSDPIQTVEAITFEIEDSIPANGWFVRDETLITSTDGITQPAVKNGERLAKGDAAFYVFQDRSAIELAAELADLSRRINDIEYVTKNSAANADVSYLDRLIYASVADMLYARDAGDRQTVLEQGLEFKSLVFRREYTYGSGADLTDTLESMKSRESALLAEQQSAVSQIKAELSGMFTTEVDGYEQTFDMQSLDTITLPGFQNPPQNKGLINANEGKQVTGFTWGHIIAIPEEQARFLKVGQALTLRFTDIGRTVVTFTIKRIHIEEEQAVISLTARDNMAAFINVRRMPSDVILNLHSGLRVPKEAIKLNDGRTGVYCLVGNRAIFKPIEILVERDNYYLAAFDPVAARASNLLPADKIITAAKDLYDGKVYEDN
ncbi:MAG: hypothetical protein FWG36_06655 [Oscillospiraceae bacterium]|nr:hypothetical protein [Oscillospiraceae bacterium]